LSYTKEEKLVANKVRYSVITVESGRPQPRKEFGSVDAAAEFIAAKHMAGHTAKCDPHALTKEVKAQRLDGIEKRVARILAAKGHKGELWRP
jgi:hypothetical protein